MEEIASSCSPFLEKDFLKQIGRGAGVWDGLLEPFHHPIGCPQANGPETFQHFQQHPFVDLRENLLLLEKLKEPFSFVYGFQTCSHSHLNSSRNSSAFFSCPEYKYLLSCWRR